MINHPSRIFSVGWLKHPLKFRQRLVNTSFHLGVITYPYLKNSNKNPTSFSTPSLSEWRFIFIPRVSPCALLSISLHRTGDNLSQTARICAKPLGIVLFQSLLKIGPVRLYHVNNCVVLQKQSFIVCGLTQWPALTDIVVVSGVQSVYWPHDIVWQDQFSKAVGSIEPWLISVIHEAGSRWILSVEGFVLIYQL